MPGWMNHKLKSRLLGEISRISHADDTTLIEESKEELKSLLMSVKEDSEKDGLKLNKMYGESNMETYITICKIDSQWEFAVYLRELKHGLCINLEVWKGEGDDRDVQEGEDICISMANSCWGLSENKIL